MAAAQRRPEVKATRAQQGMATLSAYYAILDAYRNGDASTVPQILAWTGDQLADVLGNIAVTGPGEAPMGSRRFEVAAMLHTDGALQRLEAQNGEGVWMHLDVASRLLEKGRPGTDVFARRWYLAVARRLRERHEWLPLAERLLDGGRRRLPHDPIVLCESGTLQEYMAGQRLLAHPSDRPAFFANSLMFEAFVDDRRARLIHATRWLHDSIALGADALCRLHEARALSLLGEDRKADPLLVQLQGDGDDALSYLASMFLGAAAERRDDRAGAERRYREALGRFALGQSAQVALSTLLIEQGRTAEARDVLGRALDGEEHSRREPWWWYHSEPKVVAEARLEELRREVRATPNSQSPIPNR